MRQAEQGVCGNLALKYLSYNDPPPISCCLLYQVISSTNFLLLYVCFLSVFNQVPELSLSFSNITSVQFVLFRIVYRDEKCPKENEDVSLNLRLKHISS